MVSIFKRRVRGAFSAASRLRRLISPSVGQAFGGGVVAYGVWMTRPWLGVVIAGLWIVVLCVLAELQAADRKRGASE